jgi:hypothetical protein
MSDYRLTDTQEAAAEWAQPSFAERRPYRRGKRSAVYRIDNEEALALAEYCDLWLLDYEEHRQPGWPSAKVLRRVAAIMRAGDE